MVRSTIEDIDRMSRRTHSVGDIVTTQELAQLLCLTPRRIQQLAKEGMPKSGRASYPLKECVRFYVSYLQSLAEEYSSESITAEKLRLTRAQARRAEVEAAKAEGAALEAEQVRHESMILAGEIKEAFLALDGRLAPKLVGKSAGEIKLIIGDAVAEALNEVAERIEKHASTIGSENTKSS